MNEKQEETANVLLGLMAILFTILSFILLWQFPNLLGIGLCLSVWLWYVFCFVPLAKE